MRGLRAPLLAALAVAVAVALLGVAGGALGCWLVFYGLAYSAESLAHALLPGLVTAALLGVDPGGLVGSRVSDFLDEPGRAQLALHLDDLRAGRTNTDPVDCLFQRRDGTSVRRGSAIGEVHPGQQDERQHEERHDEHG